jgi:hypothetical protein
MRCFRGKTRFGITYYLPVVYYSYTDDMSRTANEKPTSLKEGRLA